MAVVYSGKFLTWRGYLFICLHFVVLITFYDFFSQFAILRAEYFCITYVCFWFLVAGIYDKCKGKRNG